MFVLSALNVIVPLEVMPVAPVMAPPEISMVVVSKLNVPAPAPIVTLPLVVASVAPRVDASVVNAPVEALVAPIAVELIPVDVVVKCPLVKLMSFVPAEIDEAERPASVIVPLEEVRFNAPVVCVKPFEAVRVEENFPVPVTSRVVLGALLPIPTEPPLKIAA